MKHLYFVCTLAYTLLSKGGKIKRLRAYFSCILGSFWFMVTGVNQFHSLGPGTTPPQRCCRTSSDQELKQNTMVDNDHKDVWPWGLQDIIGASKKTWTINHTELQMLLSVCFHVSCKYCSNYWNVSCSMFHICILLKDLCHPVDTFPQITFLLDPVMGNGLELRIKVLHEQILFHSWLSANHEMLFRMQQLSQNKTFSFTQEGV